MAFISVSMSAEFGDSMPFYSDIPALCNILSNVT